MSWDHIDSFIKIDRNLFSTLQRFKSTYLFNNDVNDSKQIIWCCRNYSINDLIKRFRCLNAQNIILKRSFWKNLKCISIICDKSINARTTIDYETCFTSSINNWCDRIHCIIDDTWDCDSINVENWSVIFRVMIDWHHPLIHWHHSPDTLTLANQIRKKSCKKLCSYMLAVPAMRLKYDNIKVP
jgi:hypothetical protein